MNKPVLLLVLLAFTFQTPAQAEISVNDPLTSITKVYSPKVCSDGLDYINAKASSGNLVTTEINNDYDDGGFSVDYNVLFCDGSKISTNKRATYTVEIRFLTSFPSDGSLLQNFTITFPNLSEKPSIIQPVSELHMEIRSFEDESTCTDNTCCSFISRLPVNVQLTGRWKVSLTEVKIVSDQYVSNIEGRDLYIYADIVDASIVGSNMVPLLRKVDLGKDIDGSYSTAVYRVIFFDNLNYRDVSKGSFTSIGIHIMTETGQLVEFGSTTSVSLTLHFKKLSQFN